jgi:hypothetical protein
VWWVSLTVGVYGLGEGDGVRAINMAAKEMRSLLYRLGHIRGLDFEAEFSPGG